MILLLTACLWIPAGDPLPGDDTDAVPDTDETDVDETDVVDTDETDDSDLPVDTDETDPPHTDPPEEPIWRATLIAKHIVGGSPRMEVSLQIDSRTSDPWWRWFAPVSGPCALSDPWSPAFLESPDTDVTLRRGAGNVPLPWNVIGPHRAELSEVAVRTTLGVQTTAWVDGPGPVTLPDMLTIFPPGDFQLSSGAPGSYEDPLMLGAQDITVSWTPGTAEYVIIRLLGQEPPYGVIRCVVPDSDGSAVVPASLWADWDAGQTVEAYVARGGPAQVGEVVDGVLPMGVELEWYHGFGCVEPCEP